jgi:4-diphosphocytidyl-2-C-methyl-D-erythritol kinase
VLNAMHGSPVADRDLHALARELGSDVPFFLDSPVAAVSGRGTDLVPLPSFEGFVLIAVPPIDLPDKTAKLYSLLTPDDYSDGSAVEAIISQISRGEHILPDLLHNAFERPLREIAPSTSILVDQMRGAGCTRVALSGAGPAHYALFDDPLGAHRTRTMLHDIVSNDVTLVVAPFRAEPITVEFVDCRS